MSSEQSCSACGESGASRGEYDRAEHGSLIVVSAPSGAGKSSLVSRALSRIERLRRSVSYTTREARGSERHGIEYFFVSMADFCAMRDGGEFLESAQVHGNLYGTKNSTIDEMLATGDDVILDIDVQGAEQIRKQVRDAVTVFILPPSREALESRLKLRNLNAPDDLQQRLHNAATEVALYAAFDYVIINDDLERASASLEAIIIAERHRPRRQRKRAQVIIDTFGGDS